MLTPDFLRKDGALETVVAAAPDIYNHNLETVPSLYLKIRPGARYFHSLRLLQRVKELAPTMFTKSGIMVGLGEEREEVLQVMDDLRSADVDFLTIGQYLQPTRKHAEVKRFVHARRVQGLRAHRARQGLPDGVGEPADALVLSRRRGLRPAAGRRGWRRSAESCVMQRVLVIGISGAGKSTFSRALAAQDRLAAHPSRQGILAARAGR